jgi:hypothetical protein
VSRELEAHWLSTHHQHWKLGQHMICYRSGQAHERLAIKETDASNIAARDSNFVRQGTYDIGWAKPGVATDAHEDLHLVDSGHVAGIHGGVLLLVSAVASSFFFGRKQLCTALPSE